MEPWPAPPLRVRIFWPFCREQGAGNQQTLANSAAEELQPRQELQIEALFFSKDYLIRNW